MPELKLSDPLVVRRLIQERAYIGDQTSEEAICLYASLDQLIPDAGLSEREKSTVKLLMDGYRMVDIAVLWRCDRRTVDVHLTRAVRKICAREYFLLQFVPEWGM